MEMPGQSLVIMGLVLAAPVAAQESILRQQGVGAPLASPVSAVALPASHYAAPAGVRAVNARIKNTPRTLSRASAPTYAHPSAVLSSPPPVATGGTLLNADGMSPGAAPVAGVAGAVGEHQYVQLAAGRMAIYRKESGALQRAPFGVHTLFAGAGLEQCATPHAGAAAIHYDQLAKRWIIARQASIGTETYFHCLAVSTTDDAGGGYYRYAMALRGPGGAVIHADDPRMAVWPDAYYFTFSLFDNASDIYLGPRVCGVERAALLAGRDAVLRCADPGPDVGPMTVATLEGAAPPPAGAPVPILSLDFTPDGAGERLLLWRFSLAAGGAGAPLAIAVAPFSLPRLEASEAARIGHGAPDGPLAALGERVMPRVAYRHDPHDPRRSALVLAHAVRRPDGGTGLRWYELRDPLRAAHVYQQGTHAPDADHRAHGAIGIDKAGNIALGYSVAGPDTPPGVRYSGRQRSDAPGRMAAEEVVVNGAGAPTGAAGAWAHSGALSLDPIDGCTFWYTQQYLPVTGHDMWRTRIASFKFRNCR